MPGVTQAALGSALFFLVAPGVVAGAEVEGALAVLEAVEVR